MLYYHNQNSGVAVIIYCLLLSLLASSCVSEYFHTANDVHKTRGTVYLQNGSKKDGSISILLENGIENDSSLLSILPQGGSKEEALYYADIRSYVIDGITYIPKRINLYDAGINRVLFVKRLSDENAKIQLFELQQRRKSSDTGEERSLYFISAPLYSSTDLIELHGSTLVPSFETKMSAFVSDCPELASKIRSKESGYTYTFLTSEYKKLEVMKRIISEYTKCNSK